MTIAELKHRAGRLRLSPRELAERAGIDLMSVYRVFGGTVDPRLSTVTKIANAIDAAEAEMRKALAEPSGQAQ